MRRVPLDPSTLHVIDADYALNHRSIREGCAMSTLLGKLKHEILKALPPTIFFFVILHIVAIIRALMIKGTGISMPVSGSVLIASLVLGKSVLFADMLPFINRFPEKPLVWNVAWKTLMYALVALAVHYLERLYE